MSTASLTTHTDITARYLDMIEADSKTPSVPALRNLAKVLGFVPGRCSVSQLCGALRRCQLRRTPNALYEH